MTDAAISDMLVDAMVLDLTDLANTIGTDDEQWGIVKGGRLQDNPTKYDVYICVHIGDPEDPNNWMDSTVANTRDALDRRDFRFPAQEVGGGGQMWWRRFTVEFGYYGMKIQSNRDESRRIADITRGRISRCLNHSTNLTGITDLFGECSLQYVEVASGLFEGGGPPKNFIWRGRIRSQVLTART